MAAGGIISGGGRGVSAAGETTAPDNVTDVSSLVSNNSVDTRPNLRIAESVESFTPTLVTGGSSSGGATARAASLDTGGTSAPELAAVSNVVTLPAAAQPQILQDAQSRSASATGNNTLPLSVPATNPEREPYAEPATEPAATPEVAPAAQPATQPAVEPAPDTTPSIEEVPQISAPTSGLTALSVSPSLALDLGLSQTTAPQPAPQPAPEVAVATQESGAVASVNQNEKDRRTNDSALSSPLMGSGASGNVFESLGYNATFGKGILFS